MNESIIKNLNKLGFGLWKCKMISAEDFKKLYPKTEKRGEIKFINTLCSTAAPEGAGEG